MSFSFFLIGVVITFFGKRVHTHKKKKNAEKPKILLSLPFLSFRQDNLSTSIANTKQY